MKQVLNLKGDECKVSKKKKNIEPSLIKPKILVQIFTENIKENDKKKKKNWYLKDFGVSNVI